MIGERITNMFRRIPAKSHIASLKRAEVLISIPGWDSAVIISKQELSAVGNLS